MLIVEEMLRRGYVPMLIVEEMLRRAYVPMLIVEEMGGSFTHHRSK